MKRLLIGGTALIASVAALAQAAQAPSAQKPQPVDKVHTRADVEARVSEHFARLDSNHDGILTKAEVQAAREAARSRWAEKSADRREERGKRSFERLDSNSDGSISRSEWDSARANRQERIAGSGDGGSRRAGMHKWAGGGFAGRMFEMADTNNDGQVTLAEARAAALRHFDMADSNRDGQVTREERMQMHERMRSAPTGS